MGRYYVAVQCCQHLVAREGVHQKVLVVQPPARRHQQEEGEQGEGECGHGGHLVVVSVSSSQ